MTFYCKRGIMEKIKANIDKILNRRWLVIGTLLFLALSFRAVRPFIVDRIATDGVLYVYMANDIAKGDIESAFRRNRRMPPLYLFMMAWLHNAGMYTETAGRLISIIAGVLLIIPVFLIAEMIFSTRLAAMAGFLVAVNPSLIKSSAKVMRDSLFLTLLFFAVLFILKAMKSERWNLHLWGLAGLFSSLGVAVRTETVELIPVTVICIIVELIVLKRADKPVLAPAKRMVAGLLLMLFVYVVAAIPITKAVDSSSTWRIVDKRISGYFKSLFRISAEDALKKEDTL